MQIIARVSFDEVMQRFRHDCDGFEHPVNTNTTARANIRHADALLYGWTHVFLSRDEAIKIVLPWHLGEHGGITLVPKTGLRVQDTVQRLERIKDSYQRENPACWNKLDLMTRADFSAIFLSTQPIPTKDYDGIVGMTGLFHLDGLHRLVAWEMASRLAEVEIEAFIAGHLP